MERSGTLGLRLRVSAALALAIVLGALANSVHATNDPVYAIDLTPTPGITPTPNSFATPTPISMPGGVAVSGSPSPSPTAAVPSSSFTVPSPAQQASDQISAVSQQVTQAVQDQSLPIDAKVQKINSLAAAFNQLVAQWQQLTQNPTSTSPSVAGVQSTPTPLTGLNATPTPAPATGGSTADQLRAQIATVSQQMTQVSQDPSLTTDARTAKLTALGAQFNQLMAQLQQLPQP